MLERGISCALASEIWEKSEKKEHILEIERMLQIDGLKYLSTSRPSTTKGGGAAIIVNLEKYSVEKLDVSIPGNLDVVWGLLKPKFGPSKFKKIIVCCFYSPPKCRKNTRLADHLVGTLHILNTRYPESGIMMGADRNTMDISPILNCGLRLRNIVDQPTINGRIYDILITNLGSFYNSPIIAPPIKPDNPDNGKPSDHSVPVCSPHTDRYNRPKRTWKVRTFRPLPDSRVRLFGQWITGENWNQLSQGLSANELASKVESILKYNLDRYCPEETMKVGSQDKAWVNSELKKLHRLRSREYLKRGQTAKYESLARQFETKYKVEAQKYMQKNVESLKETNPGRAYSTLKRMGAQPGDCTDSNYFSLLSHESENLTAQQSAERIANHFADISQSFTPLDIKLLPSHVQTKLSTDDRPPPVISVEETWRKLDTAKKPRSGVPGDIPRQLIKEFSVEIATPLCRIINEIATSAIWPSKWKREYITPIGKIPSPETEDDLRPISLTNFFSKVTEHFVVMWLLDYIGHLIDFRQYGGMKGNSITHYLIEFINFVLSNQESTVPTAILACMVDFSKAFNRQNHHILITKLSDMGVPAWLLRIVMAFLSERTMVVRFQGATSTPKSLPGGGPQGTLLGLLLFIVLINDAGFKGQSNNAGDLITSRRNLKSVNEIHLKYVDDLTIAESVPLKNNVIPVPDRPQPDSYHARTGHALAPGVSKVFKQLNDIQDYAESNEMKINFKKTKLMLFNRSKTIDFMPELCLQGNEINLVEKMKILGVIITSDLKFSSNTEFIVKKAFGRIWMLRRLKNLGADTGQLIDVYIRQIRSVLELAVPVWHSSLTVADRLQIERVQKSALQVILDVNYESYSHACNTYNILTLDERRKQLCKRFSTKAVRNPKHTKWFRISPKVRETRQNQPQFCPVIARTARFETPISYPTKLLNCTFKKKLIYCTFL